VADILLHSTRSMTKHYSAAATFDAGCWPTALPLVAILRGVEPHEAAAHADPLLEAGFDCIEVPTNSPGWADSVRTIGIQIPDSIRLRADTLIQ